MVPDVFLAWLDGDPTPQREKLATIRAAHLPMILASSDDDHRRIVKLLKKRLGSPKLVDEVSALLAEIARTYPPPPPPVMQRMDPAPPRAPAPPPGVLPVAPPDATEQQLLAAIVETPDTGGPYLVYGDFLQTRGDVRGALPIIATRGPKAHAAYVEEHRDAILGKLAACDDLMTEVEWKYGFIAKCRLAYTSERFNAPTISKRPGTKLERVTIPDVLGWLLDEPGPGRFLRDLVVGLVMHDDQKYDDVAAVLARRPRPLLDRLAFGDFGSEDCELNWSSTGDLSALWKQVPNLRALSLRSGHITTGPIDLPKLETLTTITGGMSAATLGHLASAWWPALRDLALQIGCRRESATTDVTLVEPLLAGTHVPALRRLGITNCEFTDELCARIAAAGVTPQLEALDLSMGTMSDDGADALLAGADRLRHLKTIDVSDNYLTPAGAARLVASGLPVVAGDQRDDGGDPDDRRASAYE